MTTGQTGWYGKIASLGDFAHRRLPHAWIARCDTWLSTALPVARATLGPRWLDTYLTAPVLRFAWAPGIVDGHWWVGVLMPSCDNVGRYFPLIIARGLAEAPDGDGAFDGLAGWYDDVTRIALATLDDARGSLAALETALGALPTSHRTPPGGPPASPKGPVVRLSGTTGRSLWWDPAAPARLQVVDGLPDGVRFAGLLAGDRSIEADAIPR